MQHWQNLSLDDLSEIHEGVLYVEEWKKIKLYENYMVSSFGRIKSISRGKKLYTPKGYGTIFLTKEKILKQHPNIHGYRHIILYNNSGSKTITIHKLVGDAFVKGKKKGLVINHIKGIKYDNRYHQLEWVTRSENEVHSYSVLNKKMPKGVKHYNAKKVLNNNTGIIYDTLKEAAEKECIPYSTMKSRLYYGNKNYKYV